MRRCIMVKKSIVALALLSVAAVGAAVAVQPVRWWMLKRSLRASHPGVQWISTAELARAMREDGSSASPPMLLDVRRPEEYAVSHLPGARRFAPEASVRAIASSLASLPREAPIVLYCSVGARSATMAERFEAAGFTNVRNLEGSIFLWANEGRAVVRGGEVVRAVHPYNATWGFFLNDDLHATTTTL